MYSHVRVHMLAVQQTLSHLEFVEKKGPCVIVAEKCNYKATKEKKIYPVTKDDR